MWDQLLPGPLAGIGRALEARLAPPFYRRTLTLTPSEATRDDLLGPRVPARPSGRCQQRRRRRSSSPAAPRSPSPLVRRRRPAGPGEAPGRADRGGGGRPAARARPAAGDRRRRSAAAGAGGTDRRRTARRSWITSPVALDATRSSSPCTSAAWLVSSASLAEGWGLTLTEAAACGTPAVATDVSGHRSSVVDGVTGVLAPLERLGETMADVLLDDRRARSARRPRLCSRARDADMGRVGRGHPRSAARPSLVSRTCALSGAAAWSRA